MPFCISWLLLGTQWCLHEFQQRITPITRIFHVLFLSRQAPKIFKKDFQWISARKGIKRNKVSSVLCIKRK